MASYKTLELAHRGGSYPVVVYPGGLERLGQLAAEQLSARRAVVVSDDRVYPLYGDAARHQLQAAGFAVRTQVFAHGEASKTLGTYATLLDGCLAEGIDRNTAVIALGGGVVGDIAGFLAATCLRGLPLGQVPTTVLAMADSSVGGKTGVNHPLGKNLIGAFYQPQLVYAPLETLATLDARQRSAGLGEILKTALIAGEHLLSQVESQAEALAQADPTVLAPVLEQCLRTKAHYVGLDERDHGDRAVLNAGHTVGHALEVALDYTGLLHGEAVALGLVAETRFAIQQGHCQEPNLGDRIGRLLGRLGLPERAPPVSLDAMEEGVCLDKKRFSDILRVPVPVRLGEYAFVQLPISRFCELISQLP